MLGRGRGTRQRSERRGTARRRCAADAARRKQGEERYSATKRCAADRLRMAREEPRRSPGGNDEGAERDPSSRGAMGGKFRRRQPGTPKPVAAGCAGLRPDGVYAYAERSHGRAGRPSGTGRTVAAKLAAR